VRTVANGMEAVAACEEDFYQIVMMDCLMPVMDGFQASERILANPLVSKMPIIVGCTANASDKTTAMCLAAGMRSVVSKPYTRTQLAHELDSLLPDWSEELTAGESTARPRVLSQVVLDPEVLHSLDAHAGEGPLISSQLITIFREESMRQVAATRAAMAEGNTDGMRQAAHALKGCASALGLNSLTEFCGHLSDSETVLSAERAADAQRLAEQLVLEHSKALDALELFQAGRE
jgi:two-component system, sensor histidine kinase